MSCHTYLLFSSHGGIGGVDASIILTIGGTFRGVEGLVFEVDFLSMTEGTLHLVTNILFLCMKQSEGVVCLEYQICKFNTKSVSKQVFIYLLFAFYLCFIVFSLCRHTLHGVVSDGMYQCTKRTCTNAQVQAVCAKV